MRPRTRLSPDEWAARLDECMRMVLRDPANFPEATVWWARWRREWLTENETLFHFHGNCTKNLYGVSAETAARLKFSRRPPVLMPPAAAKEGRCQN